MLFGALLGHFGPVIRAVLRHWPQAIARRGDPTPAERRRVALTGVLPLNGGVPNWHEPALVDIDALAQRIQPRWLVQGHHHLETNPVTHHRPRKPTGCAVLAYGVAAGHFIALPPSAQRRNP